MTSSRRWTSASRSRCWLSAGASRRERRWIPSPRRSPGICQGASIELSCDAPMREPYTAFLQGGLTYEAGRLGVMAGAKYILEMEK